MNFSESLSPIRRASKRANRGRRTPRLARLVASNLPGARPRSLPKTPIAPAAGARRRRERPDYNAPRQQRGRWCGRHTRGSPGHRGPLRSRLRNPLHAPTTRQR